MGMSNQKRRIKSPYYYSDTEGKVEDAKVVNTFKSPFAKTDFSTLFGKTSTTINGIGIGAVVGLGIALHKHRSYLLFAAVGGILGGFVANYISNKYDIKKIK